MEDSDWLKSRSLFFQVKEFLHILGVACGEQAQDYFKDSKFERLQIHCALASYQLSKAYMAKESAERAELLNEATGHLNKAVTIDINEQLPVLGLGQVAQAKVGEQHLSKARTPNQINAALCS